MIKSASEAPIKRLFFKLAAHKKPAPLPSDPSATHGGVVAVNCEHPHKHQAVTLIPRSYVSNILSDSEVSDERPANYEASCLCGEGNLPGLCTYCRGT